jgi:hypothetical protein
VSRSRLLCALFLSLAQAAAPPSFITIIIEPLLPGWLGACELVLLLWWPMAGAAAKDPETPPPHEYLCVNVYFFALWRVT